jgi:hypothetical protein
MTANAKPSLNGGSLPVYPIDPFDDRTPFQYVSLNDIDIVHPQAKWVRKYDMMDVVYRVPVTLPSGLVVNEIRYGEASLSRLLREIGWDH